MTVAAAERLVVLGADGFIGHAVVREALARGFPVTALCGRDPWRLEGIDGRIRVHVAERWWMPTFGDELRASLNGDSTLILLAYRPPHVGATESEWAQHEAEVNTAGVRLACAAAAAGQSRVVFSSSADVYGRWHDEAVNESVVPRPQTPYAAAKLEAEAIVAEAATTSTSLRIATVYGPGETGHRALPRFIAGVLRGEPLEIHGAGSDVRDYVSVSDVAHALVGAAVMSSVPELVNVGSGVGRTTREIAAAVGEALGVNPVVKYKPGTRPPSRLILDIGLARRAFDFQPQTDLVAGIREEAAWLREYLARSIER